MFDYSHLNRQVSGDLIRGAPTTNYGDTKETSSTFLQRRSVLTTFWVRSYEVALSAVVAPIGMRDFTLIS
ncbi:hypothetical protein TGRH88_082270 [Toxoplasma gondii]|uniref:Uncharacterized protein n=1 Tax=Toxoplasma gondii TaxID=5811 RepID=A0A7J6K6V4_TOXGO|nr:hypothetical protein TGRH88_082270 [Toxoplasma gondii]